MTGPNNGGIGWSRRGPRQVLPLRTRARRTNRLISLILGNWLRVVVIVVEARRRITGPHAPVIFAAAFVAPIGIGRRIAIGEFRGIDLVRHGAIARKFWTTREINAFSGLNDFGGITRIWRIVRGAHGKLRRVTRKDMDAGRERQNHRATITNWNRGNTIECTSKRGRWIGLRAIFIVFARLPRDAAICGRRGPNARSNPGGIDNAMRIEFATATGCRRCPVGIIENARICHAFRLETARNRRQSFRRIRRIINSGLNRNDFITSIESWRLFIILTIGITGIKLTRPGVGQIENMRIIRIHRGR